MDVKREIFSTHAVNHVNHAQLAQLARKLDAIFVPNLTTHPYLTTPPNLTIPIYKKI